MASSPDSRPAKRAKLASAAEARAAPRFTPLSQLLARSSPTKGNSSSSQVIVAAEHEDEEEIETDAEDDKAATPQTPSRLTRLQPTPSATPPKAHHPDVVLTPLGASATVNAQPAAVRASASPGNAISLQPAAAPVSASPEVALTPSSSSVILTAELQRRIDDNKAAALLRKQKKAEADAAKRAEERSVAEQRLQRYGHKMQGILQTEINKFFGVPDATWKPDPSLTAEQRRVLAAVATGKSVFFTGSAGTGKSYVLGAIKDMLQHNAIPFATTSTTGISAINIKGSTVHSWAAVGKADKTLYALIDSICGKRGSLERWRNTAVLIIDEISMLTPDLFTMLSLIGKATRGSQAAFGGSQVIISGDFCQLPPVGGQNKCLACDGGVHESGGILHCSGQLNKSRPPCGATRKKTGFCFQTETWAEANLEHVALTEIHRQKDPLFARVLNKIRLGQVDDEVDETMRSLVRPVPTDTAILPTRLEGRNVDVDGYNVRQYRELEGQEVVYKARDVAIGSWAEKVMENRLKDVQAAPELKLKVGAQVMLLQNIEVSAGLANGSRGVIMGWETLDHADFYDQHRDGPRERARADAAQAFVDTQAQTDLPVVLFANGVERTIKPTIFESQLDNENIVSRTQLPLKLAWACSIHKSQGSTLDSVVVSLSHIFAAGMAYTATSRCRTLEGMTLDSWHRSCVKVDPDVLAFYNSFDTPRPWVKPFLRVEDFVLPEKHDALFLLRPEHKFNKIIVRRASYPPGLVAQLLPPAPAVAAVEQKSVAMEGDVKLVPAALGELGVEAKEEPTVVFAEMSWQNRLQQAWSATADDPVARAQLLSVLTETVNMSQLPALPESLPPAEAAEPLAMDVDVKPIVDAAAPMQEEASSMEEEEDVKPVIDDEDDKPWKSASGAFEAYMEEQAPRRRRRKKNRDRR